MGQIFHACAYDIDAKTCCVIEADKFHANCYAHSDAVLSVHYLLRNKPYHVMWGGEYVVIDDNLQDFSRDEELWGISTYEDYESFEDNNDDLQSKGYYDKVKLVEEYSRLWKRIFINDEAIEYFDWDNTKSVRYVGFLVNHTAKLAIDLADYYLKSRSMSKDGEIMSIDLIPVLSETGGGTGMVFFDGVSTDSTEDLAGEWCGDLMQIVDELPIGYELVNCCFSEVWNRARYCYYTFGTNENGYLLNNCKLFECARLSLLGKRYLPCYIKVEETDDTMSFIPVLKKTMR